ncbi:transcriptional regulator [uncultured Thiodictyon sp.]|jgi:predicted transcriptional regulator|uniref:HVO_A0114 family putative DNA-binding protein n=1 Tax=uncultured Thiodictyon sp. TaxID=1846217 RepID=UPI0025DA6DEB|nr:transcriptional regulator [uncultured Thiodictyon sp.]
MNRTAVIRVERGRDAALSDLRARFLMAWKTGNYQGEVFVFESPKALFQVLTPERWELIECLHGVGALDAAALAAALRREGQYVDADCQALLEAGLIERDGVGRWCVPFAEIRADFALRGAA